MVRSRARIFMLLRRAAAPVAMLAALQCATLLCLPLAVLGVGEAVAVVAPLALGTALEATRLLLRKNVRRRLRAESLSHAAEDALNKTSLVDEGKVESAFWAAHLSEYAVCVDVPAVIGGGIALLACVALAIYRLGLTVAGPIIALLSVAACLALWANRSRAKFVDGIVTSRQAAASWLSAAERDVGEIFGPSAQKPFLNDLLVRTLHWCVAEERLERRQITHRVALLATFIAAGIWMAEHLGLGLTELGGAGLTVDVVSRALLLATTLPLAFVLATHAEALLMAFSTLARLQPAGPALLPNRTRLHRLPSQLRAEGLRFLYGGSHLAVDIPELSVDLRRLLVLTGPNGSGKTTLGALIGGALAPGEGALRIDGAPCIEIDRDQLAFVPQQPLIVESASIAQNVRLVAPNATDAQIGAALRRLSLTRGLDDPAGELSHGEQRRVAIARALLKDPAVIVLDEPDSWLDADGRARLCSVLSEEQQKRSVVLISHRADMVPPGATVIALDVEHRVANLHTAPEVAMTRAERVPVAR